ncbi:MAG: DUF4124 domain-containing protein [Desulfobacteraceae bacterium]|nr:DUF4124 domain-containing protein [Desulfobacteraceae bacterium]
MYFRLSLIILICACLFSTPCFAEFYRYTDENGVTRFTDNLADIPEEQKVRAYTESVSQEAPDKNTAKSGKVSKKVKEVLYEEYMELEKERKALKEQRKKADKLTPEEREAYNKKLNSYSERLEAYEKKRVAIEEKEAELEEALKKTVKETEEEKKNNIKK